MKTAKRLLAAMLAFIMTVSGIPAADAEAEEIFPADVSALSFFGESTESDNNLTLSKETATASPTELSVLLTEPFEGSERSAGDSPMAVTAEETTDTWGEGETESWTLRYTYAQTSARGMFPLLNSFRTGSEAWVLNTRGEREYRTSLSSLRYDYALEKIAMQRAAEVAVLYSSERPDGTQYSSLVIDGASASGENILFSSDAATAAEAMEVFKETAASYSGQEERRTMLGADYRAVGIAHAQYKGFNIWVQEFSGSVSQAVITDVNDGETDVTVNILNSRITASSVYQPEKKYITLVSGEPADLSMAASTIPEVSRELSVTGSPAGVTLTSSPLSVTWASEDAGIARIFGSRVVAGSGGRTRLLGTAGSWTGDITITVVVPVTGLKLKVTEATLKTGETWKPELEITPSGAYGYITGFTSDNTACATVNDEGLITAVGAGTASITIRVMTREVNLVKETVCYITVPGGEDPAPDPNPDPDDPHGDDKPVVKTAKYMVVKQKIKVYADGKITRWTTSDKTIATVKRVGAKKKGTARVTAKGLGPDGSGEVVITGYNGATVMFKCTIQVEKPTFNKTPVVLLSSFLVSDRMLGTNLTKPTRYKSSKKSVLAVDKSTGVVTVKKNGTATISVYYGSARYKLKLKVKMPRIKQSSVKVKRGKSKTLKIKNYRADTVYTWKIEEGGGSIASVKYPGANTCQVTGITKGTTYVTLYVGGVAYDTCKVRVK